MAVWPLVTVKSLAVGVCVVKLMAGEAAVCPPPQVLVTVAEYVVPDAKPVRAMGEAVPEAVCAAPPAAVYVTV